MIKYAEFLKLCADEMRGESVLAVEALEALSQECQDIERVAALLSTFASVFDKMGRIKAANSLDFVLSKIAESDSPYYFVEPKLENKPAIPPDRESLGPLGHSLSTRYSPDLPGVNLERIEDGLYRDSVTGKEYDFRKGFKLDDGTTYPGGSVSSQTPAGNEVFQKIKPPLSVK